MENEQSGALIIATLVSLILFLAFIFYKLKKEKKTLRGHKNTRDSAREHSKKQRHEN